MDTVSHHRPAVIRGNRYFFQFSRDVLRDHAEGEWEKMDDCICTLHEKGNENSEIASAFQQINSEGEKIMGRK